MNIFTNGYEITTAVTNILIMLCALYSFFKVKNNNKVSKYFKRFFIVLAMDGLLGFIIHGFEAVVPVKDILWYFLLVGFSFTVNYLLFSFLEKIMKVKDKYLILLTICLYIVLVIEAIFKIEFLYTYTAYVCLCLLIISIIMLKEYMQKREGIFYILAIIIQVIGGILFLNRDITFHFIFNFDKNGIYHIFMAITSIFFYLGCINDKKRTTN